MEPLRFNLERKEVPVEFETPAGTVQKYRLVELTGRERNQYLQVSAGKTKLSADGSVTVTRFDGLQSDLLKLCLLDDNDIPMLEKDIENLPASVQMQLFTEAQRLQGMDLQADGAAKNG